MCAAMSTEERLLSTGEAARRLGLTRHTLARAVRRGALRPALRTPGGAYRFRAAAVDAYAQHLTGAAAALADPVPVADGADPTRAAHQLAATFEAMADGVIVYDAQGNNIGHNDALRRLLGLDARPEYDTLPYAERAALMQMHDAAGRPLRPADAAPARALRGEEVPGAQAQDLQCRTLDGRAIVINVTAAPMRDGNGRVTGAVAVYRDVTARRRLERAAVAERERLWAVFAQAPALIGLTEGPDHVVTFANPAYERAVGRGGPDLIGQSVRAAFPELAGQGVYELLDAVYRTGEPFVGTEVLMRFDRAGDGRLEDVFFSFTYQPVRDAQGAVAGILTHAVDVTEQVRARRLVEELAAERARVLAAEREARAAAEAAVRVRNDFLTVAAHDLRTPLTNILGRAQLTAARLRRGGGLDPAWHAAQLASLAASTRRLLATVDELNDMARLELGEALDLDVDDVDLGALTRAVADEVAQGSGAQSRGAASIAVAAPAAPLRVAGDRGRLARVLQNIIGNAVKYSRGGAPVAVEVRREGAATLVVVRDRGGGHPGRRVAMRVRAVLSRLDGPRHQRERHRPLGGQGHRGAARRGHRGGERRRDRHDRHGLPAPGACPPRHRGGRRCRGREARGSPVGGNGSGASASV